MNKKTKTILLILAFSLLISIAVYTYNTLSKQVLPQNEIDGTTTSQEETNQEKEKIKAPDFTVFDEDGNAVKLSDFLGKPIVLNFWASWCPPCKSEMPEFNEVYQEVGDEVVFMMVDLVDGQRETKAKGAKYIKDEGFSFPVYFDTTQDAANQYGISSIPTTIFIDKDGYVVTGAQGAIDKNALKRGIELIK